MLFLTQDDVMRSFDISMQRSGSLHSAMVIGEKQQDETNKRSFSGIANQLSVSRSGIRISIEGMDVKQFAMNPVVLACHESVAFGTGQPMAVGTVREMTKRRVSQDSEERDVLAFRGLTFDEDPLAELWYQKVLSGTVKMTSVGFIPLLWEFDKMSVGRGANKREVPFVQIHESELIELSVCPVGANRFAFIDSNQTAKQSSQALAELSKRIDDLSRQIESVRAEGFGSRLADALKKLEEAQNHAKSHG